MTMTDQTILERDFTNSLTVILDKDMMVGDAKFIIAAIKQLKGIADVVPQKVDPYSSTLYETRVKSQWRNKLYEFLR